MGFYLLPFDYIEFFPLGPTDDGGKGYLLVVFPLKLILNVAVVVESHRHIFILDQSFGDGELSDNVLLYPSAYSSG